MMLSLTFRRLFRMSAYKEVLLMDADPFDYQINDIPPQCLKLIVSPILGIQYLKKYEGKEQEISKLRQFRGSTIGTLRRLFLSVPTALRPYDGRTPDYFNIHFLLDIASPQTTLTYQAFSCLNGNIFVPLTNYTQGRFQCSIAGKLIDCYPSNPDILSKNSTHKYSNANRLGMNFLSKFRGFRLETNFKEYQSVLNLIDS